VASGVAMDMLLKLMLSSNIYLIEVLLVYLYLIGRRQRQWTPFRPPLLPADKPDFNITRGE